MIAIVATGLVSPFGTNPTQHVFFLRAQQPAPAPSPFVNKDDEPIYVAYCPWIGARASEIDRMTQMAIDATADLPLASFDRRTAAVLLCLPAARPGFTADDAVEVERRLQVQLGVSTIERFVGDAGTFAALRRARDMLAHDDGRVVLLVAVDTSISVAALASALAAPRAPWHVSEPRFAEAAAAMVVCTERLARERGLATEGFVDDVAITIGTPTDDNDEPVDGDAFTKLLRGLRRGAPFSLAYGQYGVGPLRTREWDLVSARAYSLFSPECMFPSVELEIGRVGAASGAMSIVMGLAEARHGARGEQATSQPFLAWAISRDGVRGAARIGSCP